MKGRRIFLGLVALLLTVNFSTGRAVDAGPGSLDESFVAGPFEAEISYLTPGWGKVIGLALGPDDEVYIGGHFSTVRRKRWNGLARLMSNGSLDESFAVPVFNWTNDTISMRMRSW